MAKLRGTIRRNDLEGGFFQLEAEDGKLYELEYAADAAGNASALVDAQVEVDGTVDRNAMSFTMSGPRLKVRSIKRV